MVDLNKTLSECQYSNQGNISVKIFYYNKLENGQINPINQIIERHYAQIFLTSYSSSSFSRKAKFKHRNSSNSDSKRRKDCVEKFVRFLVSLVKAVMKVVVLYLIFVLLFLKSC